MSRDPRYQKLLNSPRWKNIRRAYLQQHPLCERCEREGFVRSSVDVHHKRPVESAKTTYEMERLAYNMDGNNLEALCIPCHIKTHQEMRSHTKEKVKENKERARRRFMEANDPNFEIEQEQDDACIIPAEREQSRTECNWKSSDDDPNKTPI